jgi:hypothetical protein
MPDPNLLILFVAAALFVVALVALLVWAFKTFFGRPSTSSFIRARDKRLGVIETASMEGRRKLVLVRRDEVEHLLMIGGPVDVVVETGIRGRSPIQPPLEGDVIIAKAEARPAPDFSK